MHATPPPGSMQQLYVASLLANFFDAGWAIQVLVSDMDRAQYEASRLARPEIERHLRAMADSAQALPEEVRTLMPKVDWAAWAALGARLPPKDDAARAQVWTVISVWLPPDGQALRGYRARLPEWWRFTVKPAAD